MEKLIIGDCINEMSKIKEQSVDMIFADPPYNLQLSKSLLRPDQSNVQGVNHSWDKFNSFEAYDEFTKKWLYQCKRILKDDGTIWVIGSYHNIYRVGAIIQNLGFWILNDIIWNKTNPMPNFKGNRFTNAHETIIWASKSKNSKYNFNYKAMKVGNDDKQMRSDWSLPICSGNERIKKLGKTLHPTQKPEFLLHRIIISSTKKNGKILDPFLGTGTTGVVAKRLGRKFIGIENNKEYMRYANHRIKETKILNEEELVITKNLKTEVKVPFGNLLESGMLKIGSKLHDINKKHKAIIRADGSLLTDKKVEGSIHTVGAILQGHNACNGWQYWYYEKNGKLESINTLREEIRNNKNYKK